MPLVSLLAGRLLLDGCCWSLKETGAIDRWMNIKIHAVILLLP